MIKCSKCSRQMVITEVCSCGNTEWSAFDNITYADLKVLRFIYSRMILVYGEDDNYDYMRRFRGIIDTITMGVSQD